MTRKIYTNIKIFILLIILIISTIQTIKLYDRHFTHIDDIGVAVTLIRTEEPINKKIMKCKNFTIENHLAGTNLFTKIISENICESIARYYRFIAVPLNWTYAPLQFLITQQLVHENIALDYQKIKTLGRLPSLLFSFLGLFGLYILMRGVLPEVNKNYLLPILSVTLVSLSLEQKIMASQMESYAIGVLSNIVILYGLLSLSKIKEFYNFKFFIWPSILITVGVLMSYQGLFLAIAGLISIFYWYWISGIRGFQYLKKVSALTLMVIFLGLVTYLPFFIRTISTRGSKTALMWNAGINHEFIITAEVGLLNKIYELTLLVLSEISYNMYSIFSGTEARSDLISNLIGVIFLTLAILGLIFLYKNRKNNIINFIFILFLMYFSLILGLIFFGLFAFSPTRHLLYFITPIVILISYGVLQISSNRIINYIFYLIFIIYSTLSLLNYEKFFINRIDNINQSIFVKIINGNSIVIYDNYDLELLLMNEFQSNTIKIGELDNCKNFNILNSDKTYRVAWFSRRRDIDSARVEFLSTLDGLYKNCLQNSNLKKININIIATKNLIYQKSDVEIDLSNRTKNGSNQIFLQSLLLNIK